MAVQAFDLVACQAVSALKQLGNSRMEQRATGAMLAKMLATEKAYYDVHSKVETQRLLTSVSGGCMAGCGRGVARRQATEACVSFVCSCTSARVCTGPCRARATRSLLPDAIAPACINPSPACPARPQGNVARSSVNLLMDAGDILVYALQLVSLVRHMVAAHWRMAVVVLLVTPVEFAVYRLKRAVDDRVDRRQEHIEDKVGSGGRCGADAGAVWCSLRARRPCPRYLCGRVCSWEGREGVVGSIHPSGSLCLAAVQ
jgi:hypothetical protein